MSRILIASAIGLLGALALGIKVAEGLDAVLRGNEDWSAHLHDEEPRVIDTQTNGGVTAR